MAETGAAASTDNQSQDIKPVDKLGQIWKLGEALPNESFFQTLLAVPNVMGMYLYVMKDQDTQNSPHAQDEAYYVLDITGVGEVTMWIGEETGGEVKFDEKWPVNKGDLIFVKKGQVHCFHMATNQVVTTLVFFAPPYTEHGKHQCGLTNSE